MTRQAAAANARAAAPPMPELAPVIRTVLVMLYPSRVTGGRRVYPSPALLGKMARRAGRGAESRDVSWQVRGAVRDPIWVDAAGHTPSGAPRCVAQQAGEGGVPRLPWSVGQGRRLRHAQKHLRADRRRRLGRERARHLPRQAWRGDLGSLRSYEARDARSLRARSGERARLL